MDKGWLKRTIAMGMCMCVTLAGLALFAVGLFKGQDYKHLERQRDNTIKSEVKLTDEYKTTYNTLVSKYAQDVIDGKISEQEYSSKIGNISEEAYSQTVNNTQADERIVRESVKVKEAQTQVDNFDKDKYSALALSGLASSFAGVFGVCATDKIYEHNKKKKNKGLYFSDGEKPRKMKEKTTEVDVKVVSPDQLGIQDYERAWDP